MSLLLHGTEEDLVAVLTGVVVKQSNWGNRFARPGMFLTIVLYVDHRWFSTCWASANRISDHQSTAESVVENARWCGALGAAAHNLLILHRKSDDLLRLPPVRRYWTRYVGVLIFVWRMRSDGGLP